LRYLRFRLRTLIVAFTLASLLLGTVGVELLNAHRSRLLYEQLDDVPQYDYLFCELFFEPRCILGRRVDEIPIWNQLTKFLDEPFLRKRVVCLQARRPITDEQLAQIPGTLPCEHLALHDCSKVTGAGLAEICRIPSLQRLYLNDLDVSGEGLSQLSEAKRLRMLALRGSVFNDSTVALIHELSSVNELQLVGTSISDEGLRSIAEMPNLSSLFVSISPITDSQVGVISEMSSLQCLDLCGVGLNDEHLLQLARLPSIKYLQLCNNPISDEGLRTIEKMKQLVWLDLRDTLVSEDGKERLRQVRPGIEIRDTTKKKYSLAEIRAGEVRPLWQP